MLDQANADLKRFSALTPDLVISKQKMDHVVLQDAVFVGAVVGTKPPTPHEIGTQSCRFLRQQISARLISAPNWLIWRANRLGTSDALAFPRAPSG